MWLIGWANRSGSSGWSFGVYKPGNQGKGLRMGTEEPLAEVLRQATELVISPAKEGVVCGRTFQTTTNRTGARTLLIETEWADVRITKKTDDSCSLMFRIPFGGDEVAGRGGGDETGSSPEGFMESF